MENGDTIPDGRADLSPLSPLSSPSENTDSGGEKEAMPAHIYLCYFSVGFLITYSFARKKDLHHSG